MKGKWRLLDAVFLISLVFFFFKTCALAEVEEEEEEVEDEKTRCMPSSFLSWTTLTTKSLRNKYELTPCELIAR